MTTARASGRGAFYLQGLVCGITAAILPGVALLLAILLLPAIAVSLLGRAQEASRAMLLLSAATTIAPLRDLWDAGLGTGSALDLCHPATIGLSWLATAAGWLIVETSGVITTQIGQASRRRQRAALLKERTALEAEWGRLDDRPA